MAIVVFATTYALILPDITLDKESGRDMPGLSLEGESTSITVRKDADDSERISTERKQSDTKRQSDNNRGEDNNITTYKYNGQKFTVKASVKDGNILPKGAKLHVKEYKVRTKSYQSFVPLLEDEIREKYPESVLKELSLYKVFLLRQMERRLIIWRQISASFTEMVSGCHLRIRPEG